jgi:hypothetical protein
MVGCSTFNIEHAIFGLALGSSLRQGTSTREPRGVPRIRPRLRAQIGSR